MLCDAMRTAEDVSAIENPCLVRRGVLTGFASIAVTAGLPQKTAASGTYDDALFYLRREFQAAAGRMLEADGKGQGNLFSHMVKLANAMSVIPAASVAARTAKSDVAGWAVRDRGCILRLPFELTAELEASNQLHYIMHYKSDLHRA